MIPMQSPPRPSVAPLIGGVSFVKGPQILRPEIRIAEGGRYRLHHTPVDPRMGLRPGRGVDLKR